MPYTVDMCFEMFRRECVDLETEQTKTARKSRDFILQNIEGLSQKGLLPRLYSGMSLNFGSFERKTKKRELDDIDMMICFNGIGGSYHMVVENEFYRVIFDKSIPTIKDCVEEDGFLNSRKVVNQLIGALNQVEHYRMAEKHRDHEAARLQLSSYPWNFDIVPCFYTAQQFYLIPDGQGNWKNTDPRIDKNRIAVCDLKHYGLVTPLIRLMKYWKELKWGKVVSSYMFEQMVLDSIESDSRSLGNNWKTRVERVLHYLTDAIKAPIIDPKGIQGDLNDLDTETKKHLSDMANISWIVAYTALKKEREGDIKDAIRLWRSVFGDKFPEYGALITGL